MKVKKIIKLSLLSASVISLMGCANNKLEASSQDFSPAAEVVTKTVSVPIVTGQSVNASYGYGNNPAVVKAYEMYRKSGNAPTVSTAGFIAFPYSPGQQNIVVCQPMHVCTIILEQGEKVKGNPIGGDTNNWDIQVISFGGDNGAPETEALVIKPKQAPPLSTNIVVTTDKRIYQIGLTASNTNYVTQAAYYYPEDTDLSIVDQSQQNVAAQQSQSSNVLASSTAVNLNAANFNYNISGSASFTPTRVFDDGVHTVIQLPASVNNQQLPALFVLSKDNQVQLVNFRKKLDSGNNTVDLIVDGIFPQLVLIQGVGSNQTKVTITNNNLSN